MYKNKMFTCTEHSKRERLSRGEQANGLALNERKGRERERKMERMYALLPVSQDIKKPAACSMLSVLISLN